MRSAIIGAVLAQDAVRRRDFVSASTTLTHTDSQAFAGAMAVAEIAAQLAAGIWRHRPSVSDLHALLLKVSDDSHWQQAVVGICECCQMPDPVAAAAVRFGSKKGVQGYVMHSVPFAIVVWHRYFNDVVGCIQAIVLAGGDTDTNAAIAGALSGASENAEIPENWLAGIADWPHSLSYLQKLAAALNRGERVNTRFSPALFLRGIVFTGVVLAHGFRRLLPPY
jgi:ADP-ribosyl-[dinitrogen reductase] hydrolase